MEEVKPIVIENNEFHDRDVSKLKALFSLSGLRRIINFEQNQINFYRIVFFR